MRMDLRVGPLLCAMHMSKPDFDTALRTWCVTDSDMYGTTSTPSGLVLSLDIPCAVAALRRALLIVVSGYAFLNNILVIFCIPSFTPSSVLAKIVARFICITAIDLLVDSGCADL